jgi:hypothetical protein
MRTYEDYEKILELWEMGIPKKRIGIILGIPRPTVRDCIERYGSLEGLEAQKDRATKSTPDHDLARLQNAENIEVQKAYSYLLGIYLGDGCIVVNRKVYRLRVTLDDRYPNIIATCAQAIQTVLPNNTIGFVQNVGCKDVSCHYKHWPALLPQHGAGAKHNREIRLEEWQQKIVDTYPLEFFRGLYHSDGSRFSNIVNGKDYPRYQFSNSSEDIRNLFSYACDLLGLKWTTNSGKKIACKEIFISKRPDVEYLDTLIGPKT